MKETKIKFKNAISEILKKQGTDEVLSEAALPAYAHKNPIIDYIFWKRLSVAKRFIVEHVESDSNILDFGCGTGVFSYDLSKNGYNLTSLDLDLSPLKLLQSQIKYPESINFIQDDFLTNKKTKSSFDTTFLTTREIEILQLICHQKNAVEIAEQLFISPRTVEGHRNNLLLKTESRNIAGLVVYAIQNEIVLLNEY